MPDGVLSGAFERPEQPEPGCSGPQETIATYEAYLKKYEVKNVDNAPKSNPEPLVYSYLVSLYTAEGDAKLAQTNMDKLSKKYPDHPAVKNALYQTVWNLLELGQEEKALEAANKMIANAESFGAAQLLKIGELMVDHEQYEPAYEAIKRAHDMWGDRKAKERVLYAYGNAANKLGKHEEAVEALTKLIDGYPKSYYSIPGSFTIAESLSFLGAKEGDPKKKDDYFILANKSLKRLYSIVTNAKSLTKNMKAGHRARADYVMGVVNTNWGKEDKALASFQRLLMLGNPKIKEVLPWYEKSYVAGMPLMEKKDQAVKANVQDIYDASYALLEATRKGDAAKVAKRSLNRARGQLISMGVPAAQLQGSTLDLDDPEEVQVTPEEDVPEAGAATPPAEGAAAPAEGAAPAAPAPAEGTSS